MTDQPPVGPYPPLTSHAQPGAPVPGAPPTVPPGSPAAPEQPGTLGYWLGALLMVGAVIAVIVASVVGVGRAVDLLAFPEEVSSDGSVWIDSEGGRVVFVIRTDTRPVSWHPDVSVTDPDGDAVPTGSYSSTRTATRTDPTTGVTWHATAVATFEAESAGTYRVTAPTLETDARLGVGEGAGGGFGSLAMVVVGAGVAGLAGLVVVIVTAVRRGRRHREPPWGPGPMPYPGFGYPGVGQPMPGYGSPPPGYGSPPHGYDFPPPGSGHPGHAPPAHGAPPPPGPPPGGTGPPSQWPGTPPQGPPRPGWPGRADPNRDGDPPW